MPNVPISALPLTTSVCATALVPIVQNGVTCSTYACLLGGGGGGGVTQITAGTGVTISPACGLGNVTICASGGGGGPMVAGSGTCSIVGNCTLNTASGNYSFVGGGSNNTSSGYCSFVGGGSCNTAFGAYGIVVGGFCNLSCGCDAIIVGGQCNFANGNCSFIIGSNITSNRDCTTFVNDLTIVSACGCCGCGVCIGTNGLLVPSAGGGGGGPMVAGSGTCSIVGNCTLNTASGNYSFVGGGCNNTLGLATTFGSILAGCGNNNANCDSHIIGSNITSDRDCTTFVNDLTIVSACGCCGCGVCIGTNGLLVPSAGGGGGGPMVAGSGTCSIVGNCTLNTASGNYSFVGGGSNNTSSGYCSFVGGGVVIQLAVLMA
jgi:acyl dehydratase